MIVTANMTGLSAVLRGAARGPGRPDGDRVVPQDDRSAPGRRAKNPFSSRIESRHVEAKTALELGRPDPDRVAGGSGETETPAAARPETARPQDRASSAPFTGASAFMAQYLAQEVMPEDRHGRPGAAREGLQLYHRAIAQGVAVIGPADFQSLVV